MNLQMDLIKRFQQWQPTPPVAVEKSKSHVTLSCQQQEFQFLEREMLYRIEKREKFPPWVVVYCGSQTTKKIDYLTPCSPHQFRLKVILKASAVPHVAEKAKEYYGDEETTIGLLGLNIKYDDNCGGKEDTNNETNVIDDVENVIKDETETSNNERKDEDNKNTIENVDKNKYHNDVDLNIGNVNKDTVIGDGDTKITDHENEEPPKRWLESQWSEEVWASTLSGGTSSTCFCMAVRGGYHKQMQMMLDERPDLIGIINSTDGFTPLATSVRKGDINTVRFLLSSGAEVNQLSSSGQTALQLAVLAAEHNIAELLVDRGADISIRDRNGLRAEHYAADSNSVDMMALVLRRGGELHVKDSNGWTPLFRAVCQGTSPAIVELLVSCGSDVSIVDRAGLSLASATRLVKDNHDGGGDSITRLVDKQYPHELAVANFLKLSKKISRVHNIFKP